MAHELEPLAVGEAHVGEAKGVTLALQPLLRLGDAADGTHIEPHAHEGQLEELADIGLVVHHQHLGGGALRRAVAAPHAARASRQRMRKCAPGPSSTYSSVARLAAQSSRARYRPSPVPFASVVKKGSKSCACRAAGTPGPLSITESSTRPP